MIGSDSRTFEEIKPFGARSKKIPDSIKELISETYGGQDVTKDDLVSFIGTVMREDLRNSDFVFETSEFYHFIDEMIAEGRIKRVRRGKYYVIPFFNKIKR